MRESIVADQRSTSTESLLGWLKQQEACQSLYVPSTHDSYSLCVEPLAYAERPGHLSLAGARNPQIRIILQSIFDSNATAITIQGPGSRSGRHDPSGP